MRYFAILALAFSASTFAGVIAPVSPASAASASNEASNAQRQFNLCQSKAQAQGLKGLPARQFVANCIKG